jgi:hypothetical protein
MSSSSRRAEEHLATAVAASDRVATFAGSQAPREALRACGEALAELSAALALPAERLARAEAVDRLETEATLPLDVVAAWEPAQVHGWFAALGSDLRLDLRLAEGLVGESPPEASLRAGQSPDAALRDFVQAARAVEVAHSDDAAVEVRLSVGKQHAQAHAAALLAARPTAVSAPELVAHTQARVFYFAAAWNRLLTPHALEDWERLGLSRAEERTAVVVCDATGYLAGPALEVAGVASVDEPRWLEVSPSAWRRFVERAREARSLRDEEGSWPAAPLLTPAHLRVVARAPGLDETAARLAALEAALAAAYLASAVQQGSAGGWTLRCAGPRPAVCRVPPETLHVEDDGALARLAAWAYHGASPDKLAIVREALARELPAGGTVTLAEIAGVAPAALEAARANFVLYLRRNAEQYFHMREQALTAVGDYASGVRKAVGDLTGDVVDTVYRTVGLLVGVILAALIQPALSLAVQRMAALVYSLYLAFVLWYALGARQQRYALETSDLGRRLAAMPELSASERERLRLQPEPEQRHFERHLRRARAIYAVLLALGALYFLLLWTPLAPHLALPHITMPAASPATATAGR